MCEFVEKPVFIRTEMCADAANVKSVFFFRPYACRDCRHGNQMCADTQLPKQTITKLPVPSIFTTATAARVENHNELGSSDAYWISFLMILVYFSCVNRSSGNFIFEKSEGRVPVTMLLGVTNHRALTKHMQVSGRAL